MPFIGGMKISFPTGAKPFLRIVGLSLIIVAGMRAYFSAIEAIVSPAWILWRCNLDKIGRGQTLSDPWAKINF
jgi:hypothetical protein